MSTKLSNPEYDDHRKAVAVVLCFEDDAALETFQRFEWQHPQWSAAELCARLYEQGVTPPVRAYVASVKQHPYAPGILNPTVQPFHTPERPSERAMRLAKEWQLEREWKQMTATPRDVDSEID